MVIYNYSNSNMISKSVHSHDDTVDTQTLECSRNTHNRFFVGVRETDCSR